MKGYFQYIVGRRISAVVIKAARDRRSEPRGQLFLIFDDGHYYEFYIPESAIYGAQGIDRGGLHEVLRYMSDFMEVVFCATEDPDTGEVSYRRYGNFREPNK